MLSTLPKLLDRAFIIGFFLPSLLFAVALLLFFADPEKVASLLQPIKDEHSPISILLLAAAVWLLAVLMLLLNHFLYRFLEGYLPPLRWRRRVRLRCAIRIARKRKEALALRRRWSLQQEQFPRKCRQRYDGLLLYLSSRPAKRGDFLPTRFGNAIRAFEIYPREVYGADGVRLWLRVAAVTPKPLLDAAEDARAQVDFMVNTSFFSFVIACCAAGRFAYRAPWKGIVVALRSGDVPAIFCLAPTHDLFWFWLGLLAGLLFYYLAVALVPAWGEVVKTCFDIGLPALATQLGFTLPRTEAERRCFWESFSQALIYRTNPDSTPMFSPEDWLPAGKRRGTMRHAMPPRGL